MFILNNIIPDYLPIGKAYDPILTKSFTSYHKDLIISGYFDSIYYDREFLKAVYAILVDKDAFCQEAAYCYYPDLNSNDPQDWFEGVKFAIGAVWEAKSHIIVTEDICFKYFKHACDIFLERHPNELYMRFLIPILENWKPLAKQWHK